MKKFLSLLLVLLMLSMTFVACGGTNETETETEGEQSTDTQATETETEDPRQAVKDDVPADLNFSSADDNTVTFFVRNDFDNWKYEMDVTEITSDTLWDAIYERNRSVENRLGVKITTIEQAGVFGKHAEWFQTLRNAVNTKSGDFDSAAIYASQGSALAVEGMYYNLLDFPHISLSKPWWNQTIAEETTLFDALYYLAGDIAITETYGGVCIFYNKTMFNELYGTQNINLYDMVEAGEWTIDRLYEFVEGAWIDSNSNGVTDNGDTVGLNVGSLSAGSDSKMDSWIPAFGIRVTEMEDGCPVLSFYNERTVAAFEKLQKLYMNNVGTLAGGGDVNPDSTFLATKALFDISNLGGGGKLRDMAVPYGVLPLPKYNEEQEKYGTAPSNSDSLIVVLSSCPDDRTTMVGATLELMAAESYKRVTPAFCDVMLKSKFSDDPRDADMYDLILGSFEYSFGFIYSTVSLGAVGNHFRFITKDFAQSYEANATMYETKLETLIEKLEDAAMNFQ